MKKWTTYILSGAALLTLLAGCSGEVDAPVDEEEGDDAPAETVEEDVVEYDSLEEYVLIEYGEGDEYTSRISIVEHHVTNEDDIMLGYVDDEAFADLMADVSYPATLRSYFSFDEEPFVYGSPSEEDTYHMISHIRAYDTLPDDYESPHYDDDGLFEFDNRLLLDDPEQLYAEVFVYGQVEEDDREIVYVKEGTLHHDELELALVEDETMTKEDVEVAGESYLRYTYAVDMTIIEE